MNLLVCKKPRLNDYYFIHNIFLTISQYLNAMSKDAPILASSLATLVQNSINSEFQKQMEEFIDEQEMFYGLTTISREQPIPFAERFLKLLQKRLEDTHGKLYIMNLFFFGLIKA
jgi:hypothetical protein